MQRERERDLQNEEEKERRRREKKNGGMRKNIRECSALLSGNNRHSFSILVLKLNKRIINVSKALRC